MWLVVINVLVVSGWVWSLFVSDSIFVLVGGGVWTPEISSVYSFGGV